MKEPAAFERLLGASSAGEFVDLVRGLGIAVSREALESELAVRA